jgi:heme-degrading monooxygenase HmoA
MLSCTTGVPRGAPVVVSATISRVSIVKINAITVPRERFDEFAQRFASRAGKVSAAEGFEGFQLLRPNDDREVCLVITTWRSEDDFNAWVRSPDFAAGHAQHRSSGPVGTNSEIWSFDLLETEAPTAG